MAVPSAPSIRVLSDGNQCFVQWEAVSGATSYDVYALSDGASTLLANTASTSYVTGPVISGVVNITVKAKNGDGDSAASNSVQKNLRGGEEVRGEKGGPGGG